MSAGSHDDDFDTRAGRRSAPKLDAEPNFGPRYKVLAKVGEGGMGEVFRAYDAELKGEVALKVVRADKDDELAAFERFRREVALARKVTSPNVLRVYDLDDHEGLRFLSMEFVEGSDLAAVMRNGRLPIERALAIFRQICAGLAAAHEQGVVHRDLKPQNVLVDREDHVKVADFGLARSVGDSGMTATGAVLGSPAYMAPEQVKGEPTDERSDIYSLGIILYQLISGETPFRGGTPHAVMEMRLHKAPKPLHEVEPTTPRAVDAVAAKCLAVNPAARYATIKQLLADLDAPAPERKRSWRAPAFLAVIAIAGAVTGYLTSHFSGRNAPVTHGSATAVAEPSLVAGNPALVLVKGENRTNDAALDGSLALVVAAELRDSPLLDPYSGALAQNMVDEQVVGAAIDDAIGRKVGETGHCRVLIVKVVATTNGAGYTIELTADDSADGRVLLQRTVAVSQRAEVVRAIVGMARELRRAVGEALPADGPDGPTTRISTDIDVDHDLVAADALLRSGNDSGAAAQLERVLARAPSSLPAHMLIAVAYNNLSRVTEAAAHQRIVLNSLDQLDEHDRLKFLGDYHSITTGEVDRAIAAYSEVNRRWPHDPRVLGNLGTVYQQAHDIPKALEIGRRASAEHPRNSQALLDLTLYEMNSLDLDAASAHLEFYIRNFMYVPGDVYENRAIIAMLRDQPATVDAELASMAKINLTRAVLARSDVALARGRLREAADDLERGIAADIGRGDQDGVEAKQTVLAEAYLRQGKNKAALATASKVTKEYSREFLAAMVQLAAGDLADPAATADRLSRETPALARGLAALLRAEATRLAGKPDDAVAMDRAAISIDNGWVGHFLLARSLFDAHRYAEARTELDTCMRRRGEGAAIFYDDNSTMRMLPPVTYWLARTLDALHDPQAKATYAQFLAGQSTADHDPLVVDAQKRMAALH